jgi:hypothetical protein
MKLLQISKEEEDRKGETGFAGRSSPLSSTAQDKKCRWLTVTSHPQTDGIKLFVLCRKGRGVAVGSGGNEPTFTLE